ncbi:hypothetical protein FCM35_KLT08527 [Carex littledalei]|uniref:Uncharacterized protein n=1 Tax=Carex littledalei TaxID=544730 RepID=A0A833QW47_9POAL|nr:hypothetical protein FCM35_KLT08527 [Carex littledalei]
MDLKSNSPTAPAKSLQNNHGVLRLCKYFDFLSTISFLFLTYNAVQSIYRSIAKPWDLAFVISCYAELTLLHVCLKIRENLSTDAPIEHKHRLKIAVWILISLLTTTVAYRVAQIMPLSLKIVIWGMSGSVIVAGFYAFFIFDKDVKEANGYCKLDKTEENVNKFHEQLSPEEKV